MKRIVCLLGVLLSLLSLTGCQAKEPFSITYYDCFDTAVTLTAYTDTEEEFFAFADELHQFLLSCHRLLDIYEEYPGVNNLYTINHAGGKPVTVDPFLLDFLSFGKEVYAFTGGKVNIALGSVLSLWHQKREEGLADLENASLPYEEDLLAAASHTDIDGILLNEADGTVTLLDPLLQIDAGALGKGYVSKLVQERYPDKNFLLSLGGNVITVGEKPNGEDWIIGILDPFDTESTALTLPVSGAAVTSGSYQRYYTVDGKDYPHIIDPDTLYPADIWASVTVFCADPALADALSTALFLLPLEEGKKLVQTFDGVSVYWIAPDGSYDKLGLDG